MAAETRSSVLAIDSRPARFSKLWFSVSVFAAATFVLIVNGSLSIPAYALTVPFLAYPIFRIAFAGRGTRRLDMAYIGLTFLALGGILAYGSRSPAGYGDVSKHVILSLEIVEVGGLNLQPNPSGNFPALYLLTHAVLWVTHLDVSQYTPFFPILAFTLSLLTFYWYLSKSVFHTEQALLATLLFGLNWGVFRFAIEFRTLDIAFFLIVLVLGLSISNVSEGKSKSRTVLLTLALLTTLSLSHIASWIFFMALFSVFAASAYVFRGQQIYLYYFAYALVVVGAYLIWVSNTTNYTMGVILGAIVSAILSGSNLLLGAGASGGTSGGGSALPYGRLVYLLQWFVRGAFVLSFGMFALTRGKRWFHSFVFVSAVGLGFLTGVSFVSDFALTSARFFTYFAFPYSLAFAIGLFAFVNPRFRRLPGLKYVEHLLSRRAVSKGVRILIIGLLITAMLTTVIKFPAYIVGPTEPIRGENPRIDRYTNLEYTDQDVASRSFLARWTDSGVTIQMVVLGVGNKNGFYNLVVTNATFITNSSPLRFQVTGPRLVPLKLDCSLPSEAADEPVPICSAYSDRVYSNGKNFVYQVPASSWSKE